MKSLVICLSIFLCFNVVHGVYYKSNTTDLTKCSVSYSRSGTTYKEFYPIHAREKNDSYILDFHFAVLAASDAHILLAPKENISKSEPAYEIVIGAGGNTFSDIRRMQKSDVKHSVRIRGLLSGLDPQFFWLHITRVSGGGLIEVGKEGSDTSFISWLDPDPLPIKFMGFSTWSDIDAKWYFDCDRSEQEEEIEKTLTVLQKLRRNLLSLYDPMVRPVIDPLTITEVSMSINLEYLELDEHESTVDLRGSTTIRWHDEKAHWDPEEYGNITSLHVFRKEIWQPELSCYSSVGNPKDILEDSMMIVQNNGGVTWKPVLHVKAFCSAVRLGDWPRDSHRCNVLFGFLRDLGEILLNFNDSESTLLQHGASQWLITDASMFDMKDGDSDTDLASFGLSFEVKRSSTIYSTIFFTPFLVCAVCLLSSFWIPPFDHMKVSMSVAQIIIETLMLLALAEFVPNSSDRVPFLILLYSWSLVGTLIALVISIIVINISRNKQPTPLCHAMCNILTIRFIRSLLCLPNVVMPDEYGNLNISQSISSLQKADDKIQSFWILLGVTVDRIAFLVYTTLISYAIGVYIISCF